MWKAILTYGVTVILAFIAASKGISETWVALTAFSLTLAWQVHNGLNKKMIITGYTPVHYSEVNEKEYRFSHIFNCCLWALCLVALIWQLF